jgi:outer membrane protein assembly factor BamB
MLLLFTTLGCAGPHPIFSPPPTPFPTRTTVLQTLREKWRVKAGRLGDGLSPHIWQATQGRLVYANMDRQLASLNSQNGQAFWQMGYGNLGGDAWSLVVDEERIYLTTVGEWRIKAYSLANGQLLWQTGEQISHRGYYLYLKGDSLVEHDDYSPHDGSFVRTFNPKDGVLLQTEELPKEAPTVMALIGNYYVGTTDGWLWLVEMASNKAVWRIPSRTVRIRLPPTVGDNLLALVNNWGDLQIIEMDNGQILWQKQGYALSNPVVWNNAVYVITKDASIRAHDLFSGQELGEVEMSPAITIPATATYALTVNTDDELLYAYYGDSEEIIALGK